MQFVTGSWYQQGLQTDIHSLSQPLGTEKGLSCHFIPKIRIGFLSHRPECSLPSPELYQLSRSRRFSPPTLETSTLFRKVFSPSSVKINLHSSPAWGFLWVPRRSRDRTDKHVTIGIFSFRQKMESVLEDLSLSLKISNRINISPVNGKIINLLSREWNLSVI